MSIPADRDHYDPNQPRVPAGHSKGGQWTRGAFAGSRYKLKRDDTGKERWNSQIETYSADGSIAQEQVFNRDGSEIRSSHDPGGSERHKIKLPDGRIFEVEQSGDAQRIYDADGTLISTRIWGEFGSESSPVILARAPQSTRPPSGRGAVISAFLSGVGTALGLLYEQMVRRRSGSGDVTVLEFYAREYKSGDEGDSKPQPIFVTQLSEDQVRSVCGKYQDVMERLARIEVQVRKDKPGLKGARYGTEVHRRIEEEINGAGRTPETAQWKHYRAEYSMRKESIAVAQDPQSVSIPTEPSEDRKPARRNARGTVRVDIMEELSDGTICVYDVKTGEAILSTERMDEIAASVAKHFGLNRKIIVIEAKLRPDRQTRP
jgi:hypothetical protein